MVDPDGAVLTNALTSVMVMLNGMISEATEVVVDATRSVEWSDNATINTSSVTLISVPAPLMKCK